MFFHYGCEDHEGVDDEDDPPAEADDGLGWLEEDEDEHAGEGAQAGESGGVLSGKAAEDSEEEGDGANQEEHLAHRELEAGFVLFGFGDDFVEITRRSGWPAINALRIGCSDRIRVIGVLWFALPVRFVDHDLYDQSVVTSTLAQ